MMLLSQGGRHDTLIGGKGRDVLSGGEGDDTFVLYQGAHQPGETNLDIVTDFDWRYDKILVDTTDGDEKVLEALLDAAGLNLMLIRVAYPDLPMLTVIIPKFRTQ